MLMVNSESSFGNKKSMRDGMERSIKLSFRGLAATPWDRKKLKYWRSGQWPLGKGTGKGVPFYSE